MGYIILTDEMGERLENAIFIRGWSLRDFARKSGVSVSAISRYINGEIKTVQASTMYKFAKTLGTSVNWLRFGARQNRKNDLINRKGDTISRSALKEAFKNKGEGFFKLSRVIDLIDNAPTVETLTKEDMSGAYMECRVQICRYER